jgi:hypothetical protein
MKRGKNAIIENLVDAQKNALQEILDSDDIYNYLLKMFEDVVLKNIEIKIDLIDEVSQPTITLTTSTDYNVFIFKRYPIEYLLGEDYDIDFQLNKLEIIIQEANKIKNKLLKARTT